MSRFRLLTTLAVVATAGALATPSAAAATQAPTQAAGPSVLVLTVTQAQQVDRQRVLRCEPTGGTHPLAAQACGELDRAGGNPAALPSQPRVCPFIYRPVTASAKGFWHGNRVDFTQTYPNDCVLHARTGSVFQF